jgi:para-nitrobenzyl esterase
LANRLADTVIQFARTGKPTGDGLPAWPTFDGSNASILPIGNNTELQVHPAPDFSVFPQLPDTTLGTRTAAAPARKRE